MIEKEGVEEEETIKEMLEFIQSRSLLLKKALEENNKDEIKDLLYKLRRQNWRLYRTAKREDKDDDPGIIIDRNYEL